MKIGPDALVEIIGLMWLAGCPTHDIQLTAMGYVDSDEEKEAIGIYARLRVQTLNFLVDSRREFYSSF